MYSTPTKADLDRNLSTILHDSHHKAQAEKARLTNEYASRGLGLSGPLISAVASALDAIHKQALERAAPMLRDFAERMQTPPPEIAAMSRPHLQNMGNSVLGLLPPAGLPDVHQKVHDQYLPVFQQRLDGMLRDFEIGFAGGSNQMRAPETPASRPVALEHSQLTDADIRGQLLKVFYDRRLNADGWVPTSDIDLSPNAVDRRAIAASCQHMADVGLIQWKPLRGANEGFVIGMAKITGKGVAAFEARQSGDIELQFPSQYPAAAAYPQPQDDAQMSEGALTDIREAVSTIKAELPALATSNSVKAEIAADITQIEVETERPEPRRRFIKLYLESLRDNLAKAAGAATAGGLFALVAGLLAKYFHVF